MELGTIQKLSKDKRYLFSNDPGPVVLHTYRKPSASFAGLINANPNLRKMPASSHASSELSTASFTLVRSAFLGESKPSRCRFFAKNSLTEISRCPVASFWALARRFVRGFLFSAAEVELSELCCEKPSVLCFFLFPGSC